MEIKVIEEKKNKMIFELHGEDATFCNILKDELWNDKNITAASFKVNHPLLKIPLVTVETNSSSSPKKALLDAVKRLKKLNSDFEKEIKKNFK